MKLIFLLSIIFLFNFVLSKKNHHVCTSSWFSQLNPSTDLNSSNWVHQFNMKVESMNVEYIFMDFALRLSKLYYSLKEDCHNINYLQIGACDGIQGSDPFLEITYKSQGNIRGLFVEPLNFNTRDLRINMNKLNVTHKSIIIEGAVNNVCNSPTIKLGRPKEDPDNLKQKHWLRRQIGSLSVYNEKNALLEDVNCLTPVDVITEWKKQIQTEEIKIHILKIDTEGHDFIILNSFFKYIIEEKKLFMLPLMILFESKIKPQEFPKTEEILIKLGYVYSQVHIPGRPDAFYGDILCILKKPLTRSDLLEINLDLFN